MSLEQGQNVAKDIDAHLFREISARTGRGIGELFEAIVRELRKPSVENRKEEGIVPLKLSGGSSI